MPRKTNATKHAPIPAERQTAVSPETTQAQSMVHQNNEVHAEIKAAESINSLEAKAPEQGAFDKLSRLVDEEELKNPVIARILLGDIDILKKERGELIDFRAKFYESDKDCAVLKNQVKGESKFQILYSLTLSIGGIIFGLAFTTKDWIFTVLLICGICLLIAGVILSFFVNKNEKH